MQQNCLAFYFQPNNRIVEKNKDAAVRLKSHVELRWLLRHSLCLKQQVIISHYAGGYTTYFCVL